MPLTRVFEFEEARKALPPDLAVVVCIPVFEAYADVVQCLAAVLSHTASEIPILVIDDGSVEPRLRSLSANSPHNLIIWHQPENRGFVRTANASLRVTGRSDVVVLNSDVIVGPGWLDGLKSAAYSSSTVATVTPLTNHGTLLSVGNGRNSPSNRLPDGVTPAQAAIRVAKASAKLRPLIPTAIGHCTYFRRSALDAVGYLDEAFSPGYSEEVDFSQRALALGLVHVCADDVFVFHRGGSSFGRSKGVQKLVEDHDKIIAKRYPYYFDWIAETANDRYSSLAAALLVANAALRGIRLIVDGWCLGPTTMGTQVVVLESVKALACRPEIAEITVVVPPSIAPLSRATLEKSGAKVVVATAPESMQHAPIEADLVYRPYQVTRLSELEWLLRVAPRVVVGQQDCIAYNNPAYFSNFGQWSTYRNVNRLTCELADGLVFLSHAGLDQAQSSGLLPGSADTSVVYCGTEPLSPSMAPTPPTGIDETSSGFFLCLGASYKHKNRLFALQVWAIAREMGWTGDLVLAGPTPPEGNSLADEDEFLLQHPDLANHVWRLGAVSEAEKAWLYDRTVLVLYPSLSEGFGLVPFEAAAHNVACLSTRAGGLDEVLPPEIPVIDLGDVEATARLALELARDERRRKDLCNSLNARATQFTWSGTADRLVQFFWLTMAGPSKRELLGARGMRVGRRVATRSFSLVHRPLAWGIRQVVQNPELRQVVVPSDSLRLKVGARVVRYLDRRSR